MVAEICPDPHGILWLWSLDWCSLRYSWSHLTFWGEESRFMISLALIFYDILHTVPLLHDFRLPHNHHCTNAEVSHMQAKALEPLWTMCRLRTPGGLLQGGRQEEKLGIWASAVLLGHTQGSQCLLLWYLGSFIKIWFFL